MATVTASEMQGVRNALERVTPVTYSRQQCNAAIQAVENAMVTDLIPVGAVGQTVAQYLSGVINTATAPVVLSALQKRVLFAHWARLKFERDR